MRTAVAGTLAELGDERPDLVVLCADARALALRFAARHPERSIDVGIAEANLMGVAAGIARTGRPVVVCGMAPFLVRRAAEQLRVDVAGPGLDVTVLGVGGGVAYGTLGASHHAPEDLGAVAAMPGTRVYSPADVHDARWAVRDAVGGAGPAYVRLGPRENHLVHAGDERFGPDGLLDGTLPADVLVVAAGATVAPALAAARAARERGVAVAVLRLVQVWPFPAAAVRAAAHGATRVVTVEEHDTGSGIGAQTALTLCGSWSGETAFLGIGHGPAPVAEQEGLFRHHRIDEAAVLDAVMLERGSM
ncbi:transketolase [Cellulomonas phragmiteti]|uniref:Transketolase n=2 Tax=Cellulomonas phragmiteti TaxID=478780 RepID=A0ABQ4DR73_9CELL|nr:transketolase [Cellulomonas phragmiteti]